jgi:hypothetical protein
MQELVNQEVEMKRGTMKTEQHDLLEVGMADATTTLNS